MTSNLKQFLVHNIALKIPKYCLVCSHKTQRAQRTLIFDGRMTEEY